MKRIISLISALAVFASAALAFAKDAPAKEEKKKTGWYENLGQFMKGVQEAGKKAGEFLSSFDGKGEKAAKEQAKKTSAKSDQAVKKAGKDVDKAGKNLSGSLEKAGKNMKKAVKKAGKDLSR